MKNVLLILDLICVLVSVYIMVDAAIFMNKNNKEKEVKNYLEPRMKFIKIVMIVLTIFNIIMILNNMYNFL